MQLQHISIFILVFGTHLLMGQVTGWLWQRFTYYPIALDDLKAIKVMWFVFAPLGAALAFVNWLHDVVPGKHNRFWKPESPRTLEEFLE